MLKFTNREHFQKALDYFGGEEKLKTEFPAILQMLYDTKAWHETLNVSEEELDGYTDTCRLELLPVRESKDSLSDAGDTAVAMPSVSAYSLMSLKNKAAFLQLTGELVDPKYAKTFGGFSVYDTEQYKLDNSMIVNRTLFSYTKSTRVKAQTRFVAVKNVNGNAVCTLSAEQSQWIDIDETATNISSITVTQPAPKNTEDSSIRIVYNGRTDQKAAYNFKYAKDRSAAGTRYVEVYYPFVVSVKLTKDFLFYEKEPIPMDSTFSLSLASSVVQGGEVHFNTAMTDNIKITLSEDKREVTLAFPYSPENTDNYWGVEMPLTSGQAEGSFNFHLNFQIKFTSVYTKELISYTSIVVSSEGGVASDNFVQIKPSRILWGCLGKDTLIKTESGEKKISELLVGDKIWTEKGVTTLKNMVTGTEEKIMAVAVSPERTLFITRKHPIVTDRGIIEAGDLAVGDKLRLEDGTFQSIYYFEVLDYNDAVYCPELEVSGLVCAEGMLVGDYMTSVDVVEEPEQVVEPLEPELLEQLIRWTRIKDGQLKLNTGVF